MQTLRKTNLFRLAFGTTTNVRLHKSTFTMLQNYFPFLDHPNGILFRINVEPPPLEPAVQWERRSRHKWIELEAQSANFNRYQLWSVPIGCTFLSAAPLFSLCTSTLVCSVYAIFLLPFLPTSSSSPPPSTLKINGHWRGQSVLNAVQSAEPSGRRQTTAVKFFPSVFRS